MGRSSITRLVVITSPLLQGFLFGLLVVILLIVADQLSMHLGLKDSQRIVDDICGGLVAGFVVFGYARLRVRHIAQRLNTIGLMNHHIRNALQVIRYAGYIQPRSRQLAEVEEAIKRIDWALREILPGRIATYDEGWKQGAQLRPEGATSPRCHKAGQ